MYERRRTPNAGSADSMPDRDGAEATRRIRNIPETWRSLGQDMPPVPERGAVMQRVRQLVEGLEDGIDEGTGAALDRLIETWVAAWLVGVDAEYVDACSRVDDHYGQASQVLIETEAVLTHETEKLARLRRIRDDAYARLAGTETLT